MNPPARALYVPPCPNLGPEPASGPDATSFYGVILGAFLVVALLGLWIIRRRLHSRRRKKVSQAAFSPLVPDSASPRERILGFADAIRAGLTGRFGPEFDARTTEEIIADPRLLEALGPERLERLASFFALANRIKFAVEPEEIVLADDALEAWGVFVNDVVTTLSAETLNRASPG